MGYYPTLSTLGNGFESRTVRHLINRACNTCSIKPPIFLMADSISECIQPKIQMMDIWEVVDA